MDTIATQARKTFEETRALQSSMMERYKTLSKSAQETFERIVLEEFARRFPRRKLPSFRLACVALGDWAKERHETERLRLEDALAAAGCAQRDFDSVRKRIQESGAVAAIEPCETHRVFNTHQVSAWYTQGLGAIRYAEGLAALDVFNAKFAGVRAESVAVSETYEVRVWVASEIDLEILRLRRKPSLRDQLQFTLRQGLNVWAICPTLGPEILTELGLDGFGNDLPAAPSVSRVAA